MRAVYINAKRDGYSPEQCIRTLTVGQLIDLLSDCDEDLPVYISNDNGYTYGSLMEWDVTEKGDEEEEQDEEEEEND